MHSDIYNDRLMLKGSSMYTHALYKAFEPTISEINSRGNTGYIIPDWYPIKITKMEWYDDGNPIKAGKIFINSSIQAPAFVELTVNAKTGFIIVKSFEEVILVNKNSMWNSHTRTLEETNLGQVNLADPLAFLKVKDFIINATKDILKLDINLDDLPIGGINPTQQ